MANLTDPRNFHTYLGFGVSGSSSGLSTNLFHADHLSQVLDLHPTCTQELPIRL